MPTLGLVASVVVFVMGTGILTQQVVHQLAALGVLVQRAVGLLRSVIQQVAGRIEREGLHPQSADGTEQPADRVVAIRQRPPPGVVDIRQLPRRVVGIRTLEHRTRVIATAQQLFVQPPHRIPALGLQQMVALMTHHLAVQVVTLVAQEVVLIQAHAPASDRCRRSAS